MVKIVWKGANAAIEKVLCGRVKIKKPKHFYFGFCVPGTGIEPVLTLLPTGF